MKTLHYKPTHTQTILEDGLSRQWMSGCSGCGMVGNFVINPEYFVVCRACGEVQGPVSTLSSSSEGLTFNDKERYTRSLAKQFDPLSNENYNLNELQNSLKSNKRKIEEVVEEEEENDGFKIPKSAVVYTAKVPFDKQIKLKIQNHLHRMPFFSELEEKQVQVYCERVFRGLDYLLYQLQKDEVMERFRENKYRIPKDHNILSTAVIYLTIGEGGVPVSDIIGAADITAKLKNNDFAGKVFTFIKKLQICGIKIPPEVASSDPFIHETVMSANKTSLLPIVTNTMLICCQQYGIPPIMRTPILNLLGTVYEKGWFAGKSLKYIVLSCIIHIIIPDEKLGGCSNKLNYKKFLPVKSFYAEFDAVSFKASLIIYFSVQEKTLDNCLNLLIANHDKNPPS